MARDAARIDVENMAEICLMVLLLREHTEDDMEFLWMTG